MPFQPTPRSLRDEASFLLEEAAAQHEAMGREVAHINRRLAKAHMLHRRAINALREAQEIETETVAA